jgi:hypothetical protein
MIIQDPVEEEKQPIVKSEKMPEDEIIRLINERY